MRASTVLGQESTGARLGYLAEKTLLDEPSLDLADDLAAFEAVTLSEVRSLAAELFARPMALAAVGPLSEQDLPERGWELPA